MPLKLEERVTGVMVAQSYTEGVLYNQEDLDLMEFVSTQVAVLSTSPDMVTLRHGLHIHIIIMALGFQLQIVEFITMILKHLQMVINYPS